MKTAKTLRFSASAALCVALSGCGGGTSSTTAQGPPPAPTNLVASPGNADVSLSWTASAGATTYDVKRSTSKGGPYSVSYPNLQATSYVDSSVTNGTTYYYIVQAGNSAGLSGNSNQATAAPEAPPSAPTNLTAVPSNAIVSLAWSPSQEATTYNALRSSVNGEAYTAIASGITAASYNDTTVTNGITYYYVVQSANVVGTSSYSNQASARPSGELQTKVTANQAGFYVYKSEDSGLNHGFPSGYFAHPMSTLGTIHLNAGCVDDPATDETSNQGCYPPTATEALDTVRGTVMQFSFDRQASGDFAGINIEEPQNWGTIVGFNQCGAPFSCNGYDLTGVTAVTFDVRSPDGAQVEFGVGGCTTPYTQVPSTWTTMTVSISSLSCQYPLTIQHPDMSNVNILFSVTADSQYSPSGATVLVDNIYFRPVPARAAQAEAGQTLSLPQSNQVFGVVEQSSNFSPDQANRNFAAIYEAALTIQTLINEGDNADAHEVADALDYALYHANHGNYLSVQDGRLGGCFSGVPANQCALQDAYEAGDIALLNDQNHLVFSPQTAVVADPGKAGDARLAGFTCGASYCATQDTGTGGNNSWALLALLYEYKVSGNSKYLNDAITIGNWILNNLADNSGTGYGGYYVGYSVPGEAPPKTRNLGKSTENNADIFAAFMALAKYNPANAAAWTTAANAAGDFVMQMYDETNGRFNNGTDPQSILNMSNAYSAGVCPYGAQKGNDIININSSPDCDFIDSNTFTTLAMAGSSRYFKYQFPDSSVMDWRRPVQYALSNFLSTVSDAGLSYQGFDIVPNPLAATDGTVTNGIAWEFTGQMVETMQYVDQVYNQTGFETQAQFYLGQIQQVQADAPFGDGQGVVAGILQNGNTLPPVDQCLNTPFLNCPPERVGLAATNWLIQAEQQFNPLAVPEVLFANVCHDCKNWLNAPRIFYLATSRVDSTRTGVVLVAIGN